MSKTTLIAIALVLLIGVGGAVLLLQTNTKQASKNATVTNEINQTTVSPAATKRLTPQPTAVLTPRPGESIVVYTDTGYQPNSIRIKVGEKVTFVNQSSRPMWTASDIHPSHTLYPGSGISKCGTADAANIFDSCKGYNKGESWSFVFREKGKWGYHNHLNPGDTGEITVE
jgi:plastocyanin